MPRSSKLRCLLAALAFCSTQTVHAEQITIRADPWLPYNGVAGKPPAGYMIDAAEQIAKANGHTIQYANMPWDDALAAVRAGQHDCVVGAAHDDAEGFAFPTLSWGRSQNAFFAMTGNPWRYAGVASLAGVRLAMIEGYSYSDELDAYIEAHANDGKVIVINGIRRATINAVSQMAAGKADVFVEDVNVMRQTLDEMAMTERVENHGNLDELTDVFIACTPARPQGAVYATMFSEGLARLRASGELAKILARYGLKDWVNTKPQ